ncbi:MAG TPA: esterase-like activity of phytase family protein, partial [Polyangiaceae bacterium]|nr:esterase-like activity of phytase family protein [Polyangiaceae bacterium]
FFEAGEGEVRLSTDLEPEYIAVGPDGTTAWVSLQENDAVAVLDIASRTFTAILPLGVKDFSHGAPSVASLPLPIVEGARPLGGSAEQAGAELAGLWFEPTPDDDGMRAFYALRGAQIERRSLDTGRATLTAEVATTPIGDAHAWRGLVRDARDGAFWIGDAERAVVYGLTAAGELSHELRLTAPAPRTPEAWSVRRAPRGLVRPVAHQVEPLGPGVDALAYDAGRRRLYVVLQSPQGPDGALAPLARIRVVDVDVTSPRFGEPLAEYLHAVAAPGRAQAARRVTGAAFAGSGQLLLLEQAESGGTPELFHVDLTGASDVLGVASLESAALDRRRADELASVYGIRLAHERRML